MPPDHPLQTVVHSADPIAALRALDIDAPIAEAHDHHHEVERMGKALGDPGEAARLQAAAPAAECRPDVDDQPIAEHIEIRNWGLSDQHQKGLGDVVDNPLTPESKVNGRAGRLLPLNPAAGRPTTITPSATASKRT
jgi:hypothetical protein